MQFYDSPNPLRPHLVFSQKPRLVVSLGQMMMTQHLSLWLGELSKMALTGKVPIRGTPVGEREVEAESGREQELGGCAKVLVSKAVDLQKDFEETWA
jgi:hypothetical protein